MADKSSGLSYKRMDLHVHTPASHDFKLEGITPESIVDQAIKNGMSAIAITDHNTGDYIDLIKPEAVKKGLVIFPGVEISCSGGEKGIHVIGLFSCEKGTDHINSLLTKLDILGDSRGKKETVTAKSVNDTITCINDLGGIAVLAHCTSSKGVLNEIKGEQRKIIFKNMGLLAVETSINDFSKDNGKRTIDFLNGTDPEYNNRKLAIYVVSDSKEDSEDKHSISGIGSRFSYFKTDDKITFESLRQCFIDPDVRIMQNFEYFSKNYPYIKSVSIDSGFFQGEEAIFHEGLNSIIGAKGAGKSLLVELLRFGLNQSPTQTEILKDHLSKLEKRLKNFGTVKIVVFDGNEEKTYTRKYNTTEIRNNTVKQESPRFPVLFLSQNEIINIAENDEEQIKFIDKFLDFNSYLVKIKIIETELSQLDIQFAESIDAIYNTDLLSDELSRLEKEIEPINKQLQDSRYDEYVKLESINVSLSTQATDVDRLIQLVRSLISETRDFSFVKFQEDIEQEAIIQRNKKALDTTLSEIISSLTSLEMLAKKKKL